MHPPPPQRACVVGLGVVGIPVAAMLARAGIPTTGLDVDAHRVAAVAAGTYPMAADEPGMDALLREVHGSGRLTATTDPAAAVPEADAVIVAVQTPVLADGTPAYGALKDALTSIGRHLKRGAVVVVESTLAPGTMRDMVRPTLEAASGMEAGAGFLLGHCPERVMPGRLLRNIMEYERVVGGLDPASTKRILDLYGRFVRGALVATDMTTAEVVKTTENAYRDVQIAFANEVARICQALGVDVWEVRELVNRVEDRSMHRPGAGVGGHCIPKDGLLLASAARGFEPVLLRAARGVNDAMPGATVDLVAEVLAVQRDVPAAAALRGARVAVLGVSYLPGSDDTRDTPASGIAEALEARGAAPRLVDPRVASLGGRPVAADPNDALDGADAVLLCTAHVEYAEPDWAAWGSRMRLRVAIDGRGVWDAAAARQAGFTFRGIGR